MKKELPNAVLIGILCSTLFFASREVLGNGLGWLGITVGILSALFLAKKLGPKNQRVQINSILIVAVACGLFLFGSVRLNERDTTKDLSILQGSWQATDDGTSFLMEINHDSTYLTASNMPHRVGYLLRLSEDSLILRNADDNILAFQLISLNTRRMEVGIGTSKLVFHKDK